MGRLLRKKFSIKLKKKQTDDEAADESGKNGEVEAVTQHGSATDKTITKKSPVIKKTSFLAKPQAVKKDRNALDKAVQFLREVKVELKKVTWPSRKQTLGSTAVVIVLVIIISLFLGVVDVGLSSLIRVVLQ